MPDEVLAVKEVAARLKLAEKTGDAIAQAREIPVLEIGGQWRIERAELDRRIDARLHGGQEKRDGE